MGILGVCLFVVLAMTLVSYGIESGMAPGNSSPRDEALRKAKDEDRA